MIQNILNSYSISMSRSTTIKELKAFKDSLSRLMIAGIPITQEDIDYMYNHYYTLKFFNPTLTLHNINITNPCIACSKVNECITCNLMGEYNSYEPTNN